MSLILACAMLIAYDGDTPKCDGINLRDMGSGAPFVSGFDTPEIRDAKCQKERALAFKAKARYQELLDRPGVKVIDSGKRDQYGRPLVWIQLSDGTAIGDILLKEGHAVPWPNNKDWCVED